VKEDKDQLLPNTYELKQNYPNPFNPMTTIAYALPQASRIHLNVYNLLGKQVRVLVDDIQMAGYKTVIWDGRDDRGMEVSSGIYFYLIMAERMDCTSDNGEVIFTLSRKMLFLK
jgi:flagellar hook assembly protein FlgD